MGFLKDVILPMIPIAIGLFVIPLAVTLGDEKAIPDWAVISLMILGGFGGLTLAVIIGVAF